MSRWRAALVHDARGRVGAVVVLLHGAVAGVLAWWALFAYVPRRYDVAWQAHWITAPGPDGDQAYARTRVHLAAPVRHAWLAVMATEQFSLYVNGALVRSAMGNPGLSAVEVVDLAGRLDPGENVLAVATARSTFPGPARLVAQGEYEDWHGQRRTIATDGRWRVARHVQRQADGGPWWYEPAFDDTPWDHARVLAPVAPSEAVRVPYNPAVLTRAPEGQWTWHPSAAADQVAFRRRLDVPPGVRDVWIRIAAAGSVTLLVNGVPAARLEPPPPTPAAGGGRDELRIYDVTSLVRTGRNVVGVHARAEPTRRGLYLDGVVTDRSGRAEWFATPDGWGARASPPPGWASGDDAAGWLPAQPLGAMLTPERAGLVRSIVPIETPDAFRLRRLGLQAAWLGLAMLAALAWWLGAAGAVARLVRAEPARALAGQAAAFVPPTVLLGGLFTLGCDVRLEPAWPFQPRFLALDLGLLLAGQAVMALGLRSRRSLRAGGRPAGARLRRYAFPAAVALLAAGALLLRLKDVARPPLGGDEVSMALFSRSVLARGYASIDLSDTIPAKLNTTSELVPYPMALSLALVEPVELALRLPGVVFGALTTALLALTGRLLFDHRVGLLAAAVHAVLLPAVVFSHYARYPSQLQFFVLLTAGLWFRAVAGGRIEPRWLYGAVAAFVLAYLTWEGAALVFPAFPATLLVLRRDPGRWIRDRHLWTAAAVVGLVVFFQLSFRIVANSQRLDYGIGTASITLTPMWLEPLFDPLAFARQVLLLQNQIGPAVLLALGLPLSLGDRRLAYVNTVLLVPFLLTTLFIETQDLRHGYHLLPFLLLSAAAVAWRLLDRLAVLGRDGAAPRGAVLLARAALPALLLLTANGYVLRPFNLPGTLDRSMLQVPIGDEAEIKSAVGFIRARLQPGDRILSNWPHVVHFYLGRADYFGETDLQIPALVSEVGPRVVHRTTASPLVYDLRELGDVLNRHHRLWFVVTRDKFFDPDFLESVRSRLRPVHEAAGVEVYLWDH